MRRRVALAAALVALAACQTTQDKTGRICADYQATIACSGGRYGFVSPTGRYVDSHEGIDFRAAPGTPVIAASHGMVTWISASVCGGYIVVETPINTYSRQAGKELNLYARYTHLAPDGRLSIGDEVKPGDLLGHVQDFSNLDPGCAGRVSHLHFALHFGGDEAAHVSPHDYWLDGPGIVSCYAPETPVPQDKLVAPIACR